MEEEIIDPVQVLENWLIQLDEREEKILQLETKDRLATVSSLAFLFQAIAISLNGWKEWLKSPQLMAELSEEELKVTFETFQKLASEFLKTDRKMTSSILEKAKAQRKKVEKRGKKEEYIS